MLKLNSEKHNGVIYLKTMYAFQFNTACKNLYFKI